MIGGSCLARIRRTVGGGGTEERHRQLRLAFVGCEVLPPYGPYDHTAELFADLIAKAWSQSFEDNNHERGTLLLEVYGASLNDGDNNHSNSGLPGDSDLAEYDGVVLPGSFASAYDETLPWIRTLKEWIQTALVARNIPTLGVCFGHQLYAHSFSSSGSCCGGGTAVRCPSGPQAGPRTTVLTPTGRAFLAKESSGSPADGLELFYTHGDMVGSLPTVGRSLGGTAAVPIQAALYFSDPVTSEATAEEVVQQRFASLRTKADATRDAPDPKVVAVTFQAHPEFATGKLGEATLGRIVQLMRENGDLSEADCEAARSNVDASLKSVREQSLAATISAGRLLGWF